MDTLHFLERVLPSNGNYCAAYKYLDKAGKEGIGQKFYSSVKDLADCLKLYSERDTDVYYGVASFSSSKREQDNVQGIKVLAIDVDVGKVRNSYPTRKDALTAIGEFVGQAKLPDPLLVSSGMGFHCYWVLDQEVSVHEWQPLADALKACWQAYGLVADPTVTADSARILRPVGCKHIKSGRTVRLARDAADTTVEVMRAALADYYSAEP